ncbi:Uncharacterised protein [Bordetella pertussis]|nr:Uncharacterised protein [Bordetella pertussis]
MLSNSFRRLPSGVSWLSRSSCARKAGSRMRRTRSSSASWAMAL